jgi:hypothetical protein
MDVNTLIYKVAHEYLGMWYSAGGHFSEPEIRRDMIAWCNEQCPNNWDLFDNHFCFKNEDDLILFLLRWL